MRKNIRADAGNIKRYRNQTHGCKSPGIVFSIDYSLGVKQSIQGEVFEKIQTFRQLDEIEALFKREGHHVLIKQIKNLILMHSFEMVIPDEKRIVWEILMEYQLSAVFGVISYWYRTDKKIPSEEIFQTLREISAKGIISSIKAELDTID